MTAPLPRIAEVAPPFAAALAASARALLITDPHRPGNPIVFANPACERLTGYPPAEMIGRDPRFLQGDDADRDALARIGRAVSAGDGVALDLLSYRRDGTPFWNGVTIDPVRGEDGALRYLVETHEDVTRRRDAESALAEAHRRIEADGAERTRSLQAALDEQTALLHEVDHRVKNNLQVISSLVLLKARRVSDPGCRAALDSLAARIGALSAVHRLLYAVGEVSRFDLHAFASEFVADLAATSDPKRIAIDLEVEPIAVAAAKAAPLALLLHELATNAVQHAFPEGRRGRVEISARRDGDAVALRVADDGVGLDAAAPNPEGFGRALVEMMVRQMRGHLAFEEAEPGTRVVVVIPLDARDAAP